MTEGNLSISEAALRNDVDEKALKELLGARVKSKKEGVVDYMRAISASYKSVSGRNYKMIKRMIEKYQDGDATAKEVNRLLNHIGDLQKSGEKNLSEWRKRFEAISSLTDKGKAAKA